MDNVYVDSLYSFITMWLTLTHCFNYTKNTIITNLVFQNQAYIIPVFLY